MTRLWLAQLLTYGPTRESKGGVIRVFSSRMVATIAHYLSATPVPVGYCLRDSGELDHPRREERTACTVGQVEKAWLRGARVFAFFSLLPSADHVRRRLEAYERVGRLNFVGLSLSFVEPDFRDLSPSHDRVEIIGIRGVAGLDFVSHPAAEGSHVVQSQFSCGRR